MKIERTAEKGTPGRDAGETGKFAGDVIWFSAAQLFVSLILGMVTLPALTKSYPSEIYGIWIQVNVTVDLVSPLLSLQLGLAAVKFLTGVESTENRRRSLGAMLPCVAAVACVLSVAGIVFARQLSVLVFNSPAYISYTVLLLVWISFNSVFNFLLGYLRARFRIKEISVIQIAFTGLKMAAILILANRASTFEGIVMAMVILQAIFAFWVLFMIMREVGFPVPNLSGLKEFLTYSLPQMPVIALLWVIGLSDRYFITHFLGLSQTGIYSSSSMVAALLTLFSAPVSFVLFPQVSKFWAQNRPADMKRYFESSMKFFLTLAIPAVVGVTFVSQPLLSLLSTQEYLAGRQIVLLLSLGVVFLGVYQINTALILADKRARWLPVMTASACAASLSMNLLLVPRMGITGAAVSNSTAYFVLAAVTTVQARQIIRFSFNPRYYGKVVASAAAMLLALFFLNVNSLWNILLSAAVGSTIFAGGLIVSRAFTTRDVQTAGRVLGGSLYGREPGR